MLKKDSPRSQNPPGRGSQNIRGPTRATGPRYGMLTAVLHRVLVYSSLAHVEMARTEPMKPEPRFRSHFFGSVATFLELEPIRTGTI